MKNVVIYLQYTDNIDEIINEMKEYIQFKGWKLVNGYVDLQGGGEQLEELTTDCDHLDIILIYHISNIKGDFNISLLLETARANKIEIIQYQQRQDI